MMMMNETNELDLEKRSVQHSDTGQGVLELDHTLI